MGEIPEDSSELINKRLETISKLMSTPMEKKVEGDPMTMALDHLHKVNKIKINGQEVSLQQAIALRKEAVDVKLTFEKQKQNKAFSNFLRKFNIPIKIIE